MNQINSSIDNFKNMFKNKKREFSLLSTKLILMFFYWLGLLLPLYNGGQSGNIFLLPAGTLIFLIFLFSFLVFIVINFLQVKFLEKFYKIYTIVTIVSTAYIAFFWIAWMLMSFGISTQFGFWLIVLSCVGICILKWKPNLIMNVVFKVFKLPEDQIAPVETASQPEPQSAPVPEPEVQPEPVPTPEPAPAPEPEPVPEPKDVEEVEEELEEIVEEETKIEETEQVIESLKEKE